MTRSQRGLAGRPAARLPGLRAGEQRRLHRPVRDTSKADRVTLLDVYRDGYALRLIEVLTIDYPGVLAMAGPADFDHMARAYIAAHPSHHPSVRWFGKGLADFLAATPPQRVAGRCRDGALRMGAGRGVRLSPMPSPSRPRR